jgi:hypothetical protein
MYLDTFLVFPPHTRNSAAPLVLPFPSPPLPLPEREGKERARMQSHEACCGTMFWVYLMSCVGLVMFAGLMSGLTLGLMSLSLVDLEVLAKAGTPKDRLHAGGYFDPLLLQSAPDFLPPLA